LSYALLFKTLKLVLLVSMTIVRVSAALVESISWWLDEAMPRAPELGHKKGWENTKGHSHQQSYEDNTHQEDYTEDHAKENHRDKDQRPSSMAPTTTLDSSMGSLDPL
jgi:hypothetical protein